MKRDRVKIPPIEELLKLKGDVSTVEALALQSSAPLEVEESRRAADYERRKARYAKVGRVRYWRERVREARARPGQSPVVLEILSRL